VVPSLDQRGTIADITITEASLEDALLSVIN
jgi:hypothetical protein